jgi:hypothetical protein
MTCAQALESLLQADPSDLAGQGASPLAQHVRECLRCQRLAGQVLADTHLLAATGSFSTARPKRVRRRQWAPLLVAPATLAAAIVVMSLLRGRGVETRENVVSLAPVTVARPVIQTPVRATAEAPAPTRPTRVRIGKAFPASVPVAPVRLEQRRRVVDEAPVSVMQAVAVAPPPGTRAAVLHTSDRKLVVVWLY